MIFYFSGTGNSQFIAEEAAKLTQDRIACIPDIEPNYTLQNDEKLGFVFPIYAWAPPACVCEFIKNLKLENYNGNYIYFIATCHTQTGNIDGIMQKLLSAKGLKCQAGFSVNMPNNYLLAPFAKTDDEAKRTLLLTNAQHKLEEIAQNINAAKEIFSLTRGAKFLSCLAPLFQKLMTDKGFMVEKNICIQCGKCAAACPVTNIDLSPFPIWKGKCEMCQACLHICPVSAIQYGHYSKGKKRYFFCRDFLKNR